MVRPEAVALIIDTRKRFYYVLASIPLCLSKKVLPAYNGTNYLLSS